MILYVHYALRGFANVYVLANESSKEALIIDPAVFNLAMLNSIEKHACTVKAVLVTHSHEHHTDGLNTLLRIYDAEVYSSNMMLGNIPCNMLHDGDTINICGFNVEAISVPGHSADSLVYKIDKFIFTGDTLYAGLIANTVSQYSDKLLKENITKKIFTQHDGCIILPAHGPPSTIGTEKMFNLGWHTEKA